MKQLLYFSAPWCTLCKTLSPTIEEIKTERTDITVQKINVDDEPETAEYYSVMSLPTVLIIEGEQELERITGSTSKNRILAAL